ncbi:uncharacterized protein LOC141629143 [Silene latifolia]|uniref:uncharacterized protein LOC141629143 n=1 Tax=Silene latifolia TaxID=37657 RepID=UPI003D783D6F
MAAPYLGIMVQESPIMDIKFELMKNNPSKLMLELSIPWIIDKVLNLVCRAYLSSLDYLPDHMNTRIPNLSPNLPHIAFMVWNVKGTNSKNKISAIKEVVKTYKPMVLALVETHMGGDHAIKLDIVSVIPVTEHTQFITIEVASNGEPPWLFSAVYASPDPKNKRDLWSELEAFVRSNNRPWLLARSFNETISLSERHGGDQNMARRCDCFNNWIENCDLIDLAFTGPNHTWARGNSMDKALCSSDWGIKFEEAMVRHLPAFSSDNCPLFISPNGIAPLSAVNRPFRFQACWLTHEDFKNFIDTNWPSKGIFPTRLGELSHKLQTWNEEVFGNIFCKKEELMARIKGCQRELSISRVSYLIKLEARLRKELVLAREELLWYQKSRVEFIKDGDHNTSFFHVNTLIRRWRNRITTLKNADGVLTDDQLEIKGIVLEYFKSLYTDKGLASEEDELPWGLFQDFNNNDWN